MSIIDAVPLLAAAGGDYQISRSVRLRSSASAYFSRTLGTPTSGTTWTWSGWVKRGALGALAALQHGFSASNNQGGISFGSGTDTLNVLDYPTAVNCSLVTTQVFRDPSAWYHIIVAVDTTQATASNRVKIYVNGAQVTSFSTATYPTQNTTFRMVAAGNSGSVGRYYDGTNYYFDGYLTEVNFIDGQALTPASFGETDVTTGVWKPKKYAGTYGTNGFYLNFSDNSAATAAAIGKDSSGNGNNWTPNNISLTAGVTYDSMIDTPTPYADGGNGRGNYAVMNPLDVAPTEGSGRAVFSNANLTLVGGNQFARGWLLPTSGQWYWEITLVDPYAGPPNIWGSHGVSSGLYGNVTGVQLWADTTGGIMQDGSKVQTFSTWANGDVIGLAYDAGTRSMSVYRNGSQLGTAVTANATDKYVYSYLNGTADTSSVSYNFGQRPFTYTPPTGFRALNTQNLPDPTIKKGNQYFDATTYTGDGATTKALTNSGAFTPDLVWVKRRDAAAFNVLGDAVRGSGKSLYSNDTGAEVATDQYGYVTSFDTAGFTVNRGSGGVGERVNATNGTYVGWQWKEGATPGFDIVTYTGTGANRTVAHSLGVAPSMVIVKSRSATWNWITGWTALGWGNYINLNSTGAAGAGSTIWNNTAPTSSVFSLGTDSNINQSGQTYVAYLFAEVAGFSKFGSYTGNGSADGSFVFCGFRPRFVMIKRTDSTGSWRIVDTGRDSYNVAQYALWAESSSAEGSGSSHYIDILSNGFKIRNTSLETNASGGTLIYAAFAENPFKYSLAR